MRRLFVCTVVLSLSACDEGAAPAPNYYNRVIQPILTASCVRNQGACHKDDGTGNALGNLALTSYAELSKRRDVLRPYGSYPVPLLLIKGAGFDVPPIPYKGRTGGETVFLKSEIDHAGGATISVDSNAYFELQQWMANGANEDGSVTERAQQEGTGPCRSDWERVRPDMVARVDAVDASSQAFRDFQQKVEPILAQSCAFGTCHSAEQSDFFVACVGDERTSKFNFLQAQTFVASPPETSQLVLKPLMPSAGGVVHTGGAFYSAKTDEGWRTLFEWAQLVGPLSEASNLSEGRRFFNDHVMPVFLKRGCALEACHSPGAANDFKLRAGNRGFFPPYALDQSYHISREEFLVPEVPDVRQSRLVKKPIVSHHEGGLGIVHRGGPVLESPGEPLDPAACPQPWTEASSPFCTIVEWHRLERAELLAAGQADTFDPGSQLSIVSVTRPPDADRAIDFDTYRPGADLIATQVSVGAGGAIDPGSATGAQSLIDNCPGVAGNKAAADVRGPDASYDGKKVAFAMRLGPTDTLDLYEVTLATGACTKLTDGNGKSVAGILLHNLDPMYAPDGSIVFASTRGRPSVGPTRSPKFLLPQTDLWRLPWKGSGFGAPEQMTALSGSELSPAMMLNGQVTFTAEKSSPDFYQLSGRRINWDLTDYHPLLVQRHTSRAPDGVDRVSAGYHQATDIREGVDRNFLVILSDVGTKGAGGALGVFNRSVGPFQADRAGEITFLSSLEIVDPAATGRAGPTQGAYRGPFPLPDGRILVAYAPEVTDLAAASSVRYDIVVVDPVTHTRLPVAGLTGGQSHVDPILVYKRGPRKLFKNYVQLVFGGSADPAADPQHGFVHYPDVPMLGTLLNANQRNGRFVEPLRAARRLAVYEELPPPADLAAAMAGRTGPEMVFSMRKLLGAVDLASDGSANLQLPSMTPLVLELQDGAGGVIFTMREQDQLGPGERISRGVPERFFNSVCGGCHGSVSGVELDVAIDADALTGASVSLSRDPSRRISLGP